MLSRLLKILCLCLVSMNSIVAIEGVNSQLSTQPEKPISPSEIRGKIKDFQVKMKNYTRHTVIEMMDLIDRANVLLDTVEAINNGQPALPSKRIKKTNTVSVRYEIELNNIMSRLDALSIRGETEEKSESLSNQTNLGLKTQFYTPQEKSRKRYFDSEESDSGALPATVPSVSIVHNPNKQENDLPKE